MDIEFLIIQILLVLSPSVYSRSSEDIVRKRDSERYRKLDSLNFADHCSRQVEDARLQLFLAARTFQYENLTELESISQLPSILLKPNFIQLFRRANGNQFCNSQKNLICDRTSEQCRCAEPSFEVNGVCRLPKGVACTGYDDAADICVAGTNCVYDDERATPCDPNDVMLKLLEKYAGRAIAGLVDLFSQRGRGGVKEYLDDNPLYKIVETEIPYTCKCL